MSRQYTLEEARDLYLDHIRGLVRYWNQDRLGSKNDPPKSQLDRLSGLAFSILVLFDGGAELPGCLIIPNPHPSDKQYCIDEDTDYFPNPPQIEAMDIAEKTLHEFWHQEAL